MSTARKPFIQEDKFGQPTQLIGCKANEKGFCKGYIELGGKLYKLEPSKSQNEKYGYWIKVTLCKKRNKISTM